MWSQEDKGKARGSNKSLFNPEFWRDGVLAHQEHGVNTRKRLAHQQKVCTPGRGSQDGEQQERKLTSQAEEKTERV